MRRLIAALLVFAACGSSFARAEDGAARLERARRAWNAQSSEQRDRLLAAFHRFKSLPRERQAELRARQETLQKLTPEKKQALEASWQRYERLPEPQRREIRRALVPRRTEPVRPPVRIEGPRSKPIEPAPKPAPSEAKPASPPKSAAPAAPPVSQKTKAPSPLERKADRERRRAERSTRIRK